MGQAEQTTPTISPAPPLTLRSDKRRWNAGGKGGNFETLSFGVRFFRSMKNCVCWKGKFSRGGRRVGYRAWQHYQKLSVFCHQVPAVVPSSSGFKRAMVSDFFFFAFLTFFLISWWWTVWEDKMKPNNTVQIVVALISQRKQLLVCDAGWVFRYI